MRLVQNNNETANILDKHSMICCKVSEKVFQIENNLSVDQIEYKLSKLREALEQHINQRRNANGILLFETEIKSRCAK